MARLLLSVSVDAAVLRRLEELSGVEVRAVSPQERDWELPADLVPGTEALLCKVPPRNLDAMTDLKFIQLSSVGYEHLRHLDLGRRPFRVCNARGVCDTTIGEWNLATMVDLVRDLPGLVRNQESATWDRGARFQQEVRGKVVGLWGYGGIGRETARLARAFGMTVHVMTRSGVKPRGNMYAVPGTGDPDGTLPDRVFVAGQEREFLSGLDFLILALPHTRQSDGMIGEAELQALPRTAYLLNPARGPIIQEAALLRAMAENWIAGAALDTHFAYPLPPEHPLWKMPNVLLTPHISGAEKSRAFPARMGDIFLQNVLRHLDGRPLLNEITAHEWSEA